MRALAEAGLRVPADIALVGFDDIPAASMTNPPLTTIVQDLKLAGILLIETLLAQIEEKEPPAPVLPTRLVQRRSCGG
jgi:DNA-binding LacI/PurR family transcriptional regulator